LGFTNSKHFLGQYHLHEGTYCDKYNIIVHPSVTFTSCEKATAPKEKNLAPLILLQTPSVDKTVSSLKLRHYISYHAA
jgi:hypothetical protein